MILTKPFNKIYIEITNNCNLACSFCSPAVRPKSFMPQSLFEKIIDQAKELTNTVAFHVLGEPLLHPALSALIDYTHQAGLKINLTTNGTLLNETVCEWLSAKKIQQFNISLQAILELANQEQYWPKLMAFINASRQNNSEGYINLRLWNVLSQDLLALKKTLNKYFNKEIVFPTTLSELKNQKSFHLEKKVYLNFDTQFIWPELALPSTQTTGFCYGLSAHFGILVDGTVTPCCLDSAGIMALGNVNNSTLSEILLSARAQAMREGFKRGVLTEALCQRCGYIERFANKANSIKNRQPAS